MVPLKMGSKYIVIITPVTMALEIGWGNSMGGCTPMIDIKGL